MCLDEQMIKDYVDSRGSYCPYCKSKNIEGTGNRDYDDNWASNHIVCKDCGKEWDDIYTLTGIDEHGGRDT